MTTVQWEWGAVEVGLETCLGSKVTEVLLEHCKNFGFYSEGYAESSRNSYKQRIHSFFGEGNGNHSSTLTWKILWMQEPGRLQSMGLQSRTRLSNFTD